MPIGSLAVVAPTVNLVRRWRPRAMSMMMAGRTCWLAHSYKSTNFDHEGMAYLYYGSWSDLGSDPNWYNAIDNAPDDPNVFFGAAVASAGDVNGDGYADIIVGAPYYDSTYTDEGAAFIFQGSANGPSLGADFWVRSGKADARLGWAVSSAGDVNGDGYSDIIVGAPDFDNPQDQEGMVFVFYGSSSGLGSAVFDPLTGADWYAQADWAVSKMGYSVASAGDVNGDGYGDIVVGVPEYDKDSGLINLVLFLCGLEATVVWVLMVYSVMRIGK